ncbi:3-isopropylmalate dehydratase small subunit [Variovorax paradoxus]|uniref:3-isopropylmalate dehydratase small subunit n=1 Tax=Variovorax paradoxus TaxID=34073 RepID=UPI0029C7B9E4|nr:3-isopropylmalate dehydratase small subunit [Variovorax paradoxus]
MESFKQLRGAAIPLLLDNVDTDMIIRVERLAGLGRDELGPYALEAIRLRPDGSEDADCVLNQPRFKGAPILVAGRNFGCGSSREGAVWALASNGVRSIVAESFGDIFFNNCLQNGVLPVRLPRDEVERLAAQAADGSAVVVDLQAQQVIFPDQSAHAFEIDAMKRAALLEGLDDVSLTLRRQAAIQAWQAQDRLARPWVWEPVAQHA